MSLAARPSVEVMVPVRKPRPSGEKGTRPTPSRRAVGSTDSSTPRVHSEYSLCTALIGCTAWARSNSSAVTSERPR